MLNITLELLFIFLATMLALFSGKIMSFEINTEILRIEMT